MEQKKKLGDHTFAIEAFRKKEKAYKYVSLKALLYSLNVKLVNSLSGQIETFSQNLKNAIFVKCKNLLFD